MKMDFFKNIWEMPKKFLSKGSSNLGPFTWNLNEGNLGINPQIGGSDADQLGIIMNGADDILIRFGSANIDIPLNSLFIDGNSINGLTTLTASSAITPVKIFTQGVNKYLFIGLLASEMIACVNEDDEKDFGKKLTYNYEIVDYDEFNPS